MGLLDGMLGGVLKEVLGGGSQQQGAGIQGQGALAALLPIVLGMMMNRGGGQAFAAPAAPSGGLGDVLGGLLGGGSGSGGLGDLLNQLQRAGFGEQAKSWVGTGQNLPISPDAIGQIFGGDAVSRIAQQAGLSEPETSAGLSQLLPEVVDKLTPEGRVPDLDQLSSGLDSLRSQLGLG